MSGSNANSVFYAEAYHPIQAGSIDGTDILPHDNAVFRALLYSSAGLYDPLGDPKVIGNPYCTVFVGRLSHLTTEDTLRQAMSKYGRIKNLRLVRHIVTGASRGYAFVEFETEKEMRHAYKDAHHSFIDDCEVIVDYNRQQLMPGWIPRRLGGGLGGKKESGQLRFGGRERPFRAPLRPIPHVELKRLGIPPPPEGRYMSRFQTPSPPRSKVSSAINREGYYYKRSSSMDDWEEHNSRSSPPNKGEMTRKRSEDHKRRSQKQSSRSVERKEDGSHENKRSDEAGRRRYHNRSSFEREDLSRKRSRSSKDKSGRSRSAKE